MTLNGTVICGYETGKDLEGDLFEIQLLHQPVKTEGKPQSAFIRRAGAVVEIRTGYVWHANLKL
jgi:hypothetical protein